MMRIPPNDVGAEQSLLGSILLNKNVLLKVPDIVKAEDFYDERHWQLYSCFLDLYSQGKPIDLVTTASELASRKILERIGWASYLGQIMKDTPSALHAMSYAQIIADKALLRWLTVAWQWIQDLWFDQSITPVDALNKASEIMSHVSSSTTWDNMSTILELAEWCFERFSYVQETGIVSEWISTWYKSLDNLIGGLSKWDLIIVAARPSMGKTAFMLNLVTNVAEKFEQKVAVFSLEMDKQKLADRMLFSMMGLSKEIYNTKVSEAKSILVEKFVDRASKMKIVIDDASNITTQQIEARCRKVQKEQWLDVVFIDYLQLIQWSNKENRTQEVSEMTRQLKGVAKRLEVPIVCLSQLSRAVETRTDKRPNLSDLRESGSIEQDADIVMMLYREQYYQTDGWNNLEVLVKKNRNGEVWTAVLWFDMQKQKIFEKL